MKSKLFLIIGLLWMMTIGIARAESLDVTTPISCEFTKVSDYFQIGCPSTFAYKIQGGSNQFENVQLNLEYSIGNGYGGGYILEWKTVILHENEGLYTFIPRMGSIVGVYIRGKDVVTGNEFNEGWYNTTST